MWPGLIIHSSSIWIPMMVFDFLRRSIALWNNHFFPFSFQSTLDIWQSMLTFGLYNSSNFPLMANLTSSFLFSFSAISSSFSAFSMLGWMLSKHSLTHFSVTYIVSFNLNWMLAEALPSIFSPILRAMTIFRGINWKTWKEGGLNVLFWSVTQSVHDLSFFFSISIGSGHLLCSPHYSYKLC